MIFAALGVVTKRKGTARSSHIGLTLARGTASRMLSGGFYPHVPSGQNPTDMRYEVRTSRQRRYEFLEGRRIEVHEGELAGDGRWQDRVAGLGLGHGQELQAAQGGRHFAPKYTEWCEADHLLGGSSRLHSYLNCALSLIFKSLT
jgi:hypothetical protein